MMSKKKLNQSVRRHATVLIIWKPWKTKLRFTSVKEVCNGAKPKALHYDL